MNQGRQIIPVEMEERIAELEELMSFGKLKDKTLHELFDLYNGASLLAEENHEDNLFIYYIKKMQSLFSNENVQKISEKALVQQFSLTPEEKKKKIQEIKKKLSQKKETITTNAKCESSDILKTFKFRQNQTSQLFSNQLDSQTKSFKEKLEAKRNASTSNSQKPRLRRAITTYSKSPNSALSGSTLSSLPSLDKEDLTPNQELQKEHKPRIRKPSIILETKYDAQLDEILNRLWNLSEKNVESLISTKIEEINNEYNEKFNKSLIEIYDKFYNDIKEIDLEEAKKEDDPNSIVLKELTKERDELIEKLKESNSKERKEKISEAISEKKEKENFDKIREISIIKIELMSELRKIQKGMSLECDSESEERTPSKSSRKNTRESRKSRHDSMRRSDAFENEQKKE